MENQIWMWVGFNAFVLFMLALDLGVFNRKDHEIKIKEALAWSTLWIVLALAFNVLLYYTKGPEPALQFLTGYIIEKSLSVDNIFVFVLVFSFFKVPALYQHRVLFWGIIGALIMRAIFIAAGVTLIEKFHWIIYVFGAFLIFTGIKLAVNQGTKVDPEHNPVVKLFRKFFPVTKQYHGNKFWVMQHGKKTATPLFIVLLLIETTDLIFAVDSIPAILAVTNDPFIVYTSNVFAILGLRSLYFALAGVMHLFKYLHYGLAAILIFVGIKMVIVDYYKIPIDISLFTIAGILTLSVLLSLFSKKNAPKLLKE
jgi:tellurite resistance protein TerC